MWTMKNGTNAMQANAHSRSAAFRNLSPQCGEERLDLPPLQVAGNRLGKDGFKGGLLFGIHFEEKMSCRAAFCNAASHVPK
jgi:hypothetical protein